MTKQKTNLPQKFGLLALIALVFLLDQFSKWMVTQLLIAPAAGQKTTHFIDWMQHATGILPFAEFKVTSFYNIVMVWNYGVSFGLFHDKSPESTLFLVGVAALICFGLLLWMLDTKDRALAMCLALAVGGAIGNIFDRLRFGAVIDFIDIHAMGYHWPAFNLADSCIVIGIGIVILKTFLGEKDEAPKTTT